MTYEDFKKGVLMGEITGGERTSSMFTEWREEMLRDMVIVEQLKFDATK